MFDDYIVKVIGQDVYWRYDGTLTTEKSKAYCMEYSTAEKVINELKKYKPTAIPLALDGG